MAKLSSPRTELAVLRAACHRDPLVAGSVLQSVDESFFYSEEAQDSFNLIRQLRNETGNAVSFRMLLENPGLTRSAGEFLRNSEAVIQDRKQAKAAIGVLEEYRRRRHLAEIANNIGSALDKPKVNSKLLLDQATQGLSRARASKSQNAFTRFGLRDNGSDLVRRILHEKRTDDIIPTGFKSYDEINGGMFKGSLFGVAATTSGGKSVMVNQLAVNMSSAGYPVDILPLEMSELEMTVRMMANVCKFDPLKLLLQKTTRAEREMVEKKFLAWRKHLHRKGSWYNIYKPDEDVSIEDALAALSTYNSPVKIIDYVGLLAGMDGDDQAKRLGAAARYAKVYAEATNSLVILVAQLDDAGRVRYSRAIAEHCNDLWTWVADNESREAGVINVVQTKARNHRMFNFSLKIDPQTMRITDLPNGGVGGNQSGGKDELLPNLVEEIH